MRLLKPVYLCGPINGRSDADCNDWRTKAKGMLDATWDPMARDYRGRESEPGINVEIVEGDKADILKCRAIVVYFDKPSVGTSMEVMFADTHGIPVHVVNASGKAAVAVAGLPRDHHSPDVRVGMCRAQRLSAGTHNANPRRSRPPHCLRLPLQPERCASGDAARGLHDHA